MLKVVEISNVSTPQRTDSAAGGEGWEPGVSRCKLSYRGWIHNEKVQSDLVINRTERKRKNVHIYIEREYE